MKRLLWFTQTNINHVIDNKLSFRFQDKSIDLTEFIIPFTKNCLWEKGFYRDEYVEPFKKCDLEKIETIKVHLNYGNYPYSNFHNYENLINKYLGNNKIEREKIISSSIGEASKIAVIEVLYRSENPLLKNLTYEEQKDSDLVFKNLSDSDNITLIEQNKIKSIICEFLQFLVFNLHLNFLTKDYEFNFSQKPSPIGFIAISDKDDLYYETDKIELLSHYILWENSKDNLFIIMKTTSEFWCKYFPSVHFFLDALKGNFMTSISFTKLVFTLESFFPENTSTDFMTLVIPLLISNTIKDMKSDREILKKSFSLRNDIVHGGKIHSLKGNQTLSPLFFDLKNIIIRLFYFLINKDLFTGRQNLKLNHELIFKLLPFGIESYK